MDSKNIFIASNHLRQTAQWETPAEKEWRFCGRESSFEKSLVREEIDTFFPENEIYISINRTTGQSISKAEAVDIIERKIQTDDIRLTDIGFSKIIEFNQNGIYRIGTK